VVTCYKFTPRNEGQLDRMSAARSSDFTLVGYGVGDPSAVDFGRINVIESFKGGTLG